MTQVSINSFQTTKALEKNLPDNSQEMHNMDVDQEDMSLSIEER